MTKKNPNARSKCASRPEMHVDARRSEKPCGTCAVVKSLGEFYWVNRATNRRQSECRDCMRRRNNAWFAANRLSARVKNAVATTKSRKANPVAVMLRSAKARAKALGIEFDLSVEGLVVPEFCPVMGFKMVWSIGERPTYAQRQMSPSIDRIDRRFGYVPGNIVIVSWRANRLKNDATIDELRRLADFYAPLERNRNIERPIYPGSLDQSRPAQGGLPPVQSSSEEENSAMPIGADRCGCGPVEVFSLPMVRGPQL